MNKDKRLVMHVSLSEEGKKEAQRIAKEIADRMDALKYAFLQMGGVNITPHTDRPPKPLDQWTKKYPLIEPIVKKEMENSIRLDMLKPCPIQDELIEWLKEQQKKEVFKREYLCQWVDVTPAPFSQHELDLQMWREDRIKRATESKPREDDPELFGTFGYELMGIDLGKGEENGND